MLWGYEVGYLGVRDVGGFEGCCGSRKEFWGCSGSCESVRDIVGL